MKRQRGAYLVMMAILIVVLIGIAALAIDVGRLLVMRTEMHNGVDAASLAAAGELDSNNNAQERAKSAARQLLQHDARFARVREILGDTGLPDGAFEFFCVIGSKTDPDADSAIDAGFCQGSKSASEPKKVIASGDADSHYVRITLDPALVGDGDRFTTDLLFLPVLGALGIEVANTATAVVRALAGRSFFTCNYPPMALCDPWEGTGSHFRDEMPVGGHIELRQQGSNNWSPGNFGFLQPKDDGPGASKMVEYLANPNLAGCSPPIVTSQTGTIAAKTRAAFNVRFDIYDGPNPFREPDGPDDYPPAPDIVEYPLDQTMQAIDDRFGTGDWDFETYWDDTHGTTYPNGWSNSSRPTRHEVYEHEIDNGIIPEEPDPSHQGPGVVPDRRVMTLAVLSCEALDFQGKKEARVFPDDGFAEIFILTQSEAPGGGGSGLVIYGEYLRWVEGSDEDFHVNVQLYE